MILFALLMLFAARAMIKSSNDTTEEFLAAKKINVGALLFYGVGIGLATGILGAGGGFL